MTRSFLQPPHYPRRARRLPHLIPLALACLATACLTCGCVGLTASALGTVAGVGAAVVTTGTDIYRLGKLDTVQMAPWVDVMAAVREAADDLHLKTREKAREEDAVAHFEFEDDRKAGVSVRVERRTETLQRIRIDVGLFGSEPTARLFLARLRARLPDATAPVPKSAET